MEGVNEMMTLYIDLMQLTVTVHAPPPPPLLLRLQEYTAAAAAVYDAALLHIKAVTYYFKADKHGAAQIPYDTPKTIYTPSNGLATRH